MANYILGYGSLINLQSLTETMQRDILSTDIIAVKLNGYKRIWNLKDTIITFDDNRTITGIFLNIAKSDADWTNGIIFEVSDEELKSLDERERNYVKHDVSEKVRAYTDIDLSGAKIYSYVAENPIYLQDKASENTYVMDLYVEIVEKGCKAIGEAFYQDYLTSTAKHEFSTLEGDYDFVKKVDQ